jgi:hypothetical protein
VSSTLTLTAVPADHRVDIGVTTTTAAAATVSVSRRLRRNWQPVEQMQGVPLTAAAPAAGSDYEILFNSPIEYIARVHDAAGALIETARAPAVTVPGDEVWLRNVARPALSMPIQVVHMESGDNTDETRAAMLRPLGRRNPVVLTDVRSGASGTISVLTADDDEHISLRYLFASGDVLLLTGPADYDILWPLYIAVGATAMRRVSGALDTARLFTWDWTQVDPPPAGARLKTRTWADVDAEFASWDDVLLTQNDWADLLYVDPVAVVRMGVL